MNKEFLRFLFIGSLNTAITYVLYLLFLRYIPYIMAFSSSFVIGLALVSILNVKYVYGAEVSLRNSLKTIGIYLLQYVLSVLFLFVLVNYLSIGVKIAPLVVICVLVPATFLENKFILTKG